MVKIREALPLVGGQTTAEDSVQQVASIAAEQRLGTTESDIGQHIDSQAWFNSLCHRFQVADLPSLKKAYQLAKQLTRQSSIQSSAYLTGLGMADILSYMQTDEDVLVAAMLYRCAREALIDFAGIKKAFGKSIAQLVTDTLAMGQLSEMIEKNKRLEDHFSNNQREHLAGIYKMLISVTNDVRVVLIKLAERTFAMRELSYATEERQQRVAREVMTIYAPLAHRLGIAQLKWELEDLAFRYLAPERYREIARLLSEKRTEREAYILRVTQQIEHALAEQSITAEVTGRVKHIYSIYRKMKLKGLSFDQLYDIRAIRVLVDEKSTCYHVLGIVHGLWRHIPDQFDDYITNPKANGYRSLHTAVIAEQKSLEIQIRTHAMHYEAELGMCAHVNYKEGTKNKDAYFSEKLNSLRQFLINYDKQDSDDTEDHPYSDWNEFERIYVFTRDGDVAELPKGSTVLDFAYHVHTEVGNHCQAARVNKRYVPLTYQLKTGEQVEVITKANREPNRDWLVPALGFIHSSRARSKLKQWFRQQDRSKNVEVGKGMLTQELARLALHPNSIDLNDYIEHFNVNHAEDILVALVTGDINLADLTEQISKQLQLEPDVDDDEQLVPSVHPKATGKLDAYKIQVDGLDNIDLKLAGCCNPVHGEPIAGFITNMQGVSIHHEDCPEYARLVAKEPEKAIHATWYSKTGRYQPVQIFVEAYDRRGLLKDLANVIDQEHVNIIRVETLSENSGFARMNLHLEVSGLSHLSRLLAKLEQQPGIVVARRVVN